MISQGGWENPTRLIRYSTQPTNTISKTTAFRFPVQLSSSVRNVPALVRLNISLQKFLLSGTCFEEGEKAATGGGALELVADNGTITIGNAAVDSTLLI